MPTTSPPTAPDVADPASPAPAVAEPAAAESAVATTSLTDQEVAAQIPRNIAIGTVIMFVLLMAGCLAAGLTLLSALGVAVLPTIIFGPFVGGLITVAAYSRVEGADGH